MGGVGSFDIKVTPREQTDARAFQRRHRIGPGERFDRAAPPAACSLTLIWLDPSRSWG
jgi:hypothetical protein